MNRNQTVVEQLKREKIQERNGEAVHNNQNATQRIYDVMILYQAYAKISNTANGHRSSDYGVLDRYCRKPSVNTQA